MGCTVAWFAKPVGMTVSTIDEDEKRRADANASASAWVLDWAQAPPGWNWAAQDGDGRWFWYRSPPQPGFAGRVWRAHSRSQQLAGQGAPNLDWHLTLEQRPVG